MVKRIIATSVQLFFIAAKHKESNVTLTHPGWTYGRVEEWQNCDAGTSYTVVKVWSSLYILCGLAWYPFPVTSKRIVTWKFSSRSLKTMGCSLVLVPLQGLIWQECTTNEPCAERSKNGGKHLCQEKWWRVRWKGWRLAPVLADKDTSVRILCVRPQPNGSASECMSFQPLHSPTLLSVRWEEGWAVKLVESTYWYGMLK